LLPSASTQVPTVEPAAVAHLAGAMQPGPLVVSQPAPSAASALHVPIIGFAPPMTLP
jgi:hypothetical protein